MVERIAIVGAGFCGSVLATMLLRRNRARELDLVLIGRDGAVGRGIAYARREVDYLLNVPAGRLSANADDPLEFLRFAQARDAHADAEDFLPRAWYGDYIEAGLRTAQGASESARLSIVAATATALRFLPAAEWSEGPPIEIRLDRGGSLRADAVVLALGNSPPRPLAAAAALEDGTYCADPWLVPAHFAELESLLIIGNGLTMADVALRLSAVPERMPLIHTISRHGLLPQLQTTFRPAAIRGDAAVLLDAAPSIRRLLAASRDMARRVERLGGDWREVVTFVRHSAPSLWQRLPGTERRRFLRHLQCHWDTHRHRMPPALGARLADLRRAGKLDINAGSIESLTPQRGRVRVRWRPRGREIPVEWTVDAVINATGCDYSLARSTDPLVKNLLAAGLMSADALQLGVRTDANHALIGADGNSRAGLYYLGPLLRADHWEATAVTELRDHASVLAGHLLALT